VETLRSSNFSQSRRQFSHCSRQWGTDVEIVFIDFSIVGSLKLFT
jgi:hypothetical protein